ncbi:MAG: hypothetical protein ACRD26_11405 [Vicinamibacterales bacterium]
MRRRGKRAVWAALDSNLPSLRVAVTLGFQATGKLYVLAKKPGASLS